MIHRRPARTIAARWLARLAFATFVAWAGSAAALAETVLPALARQEDQARFRVTAFATGLGYPTSMTTLADGSLLVATSDGGTDWQANSLFASPRGALVRLVDADGDGAADGPAQTMAADLPGLVTSVRRVGDLVFALSSKAGRETVTILRTGSSPVAPLTAAGRLSFTFPAGFEHTTYALAARATQDGGVALYFNTGSRQNSVATPADVRVGIAAGDGAVELAFAPGTFPADFAGGLFVPFSGVFNQGGPANDENPVVVVDPATGERFHFIKSGVMGHPNGLLASDTGLFITDLNPTGRFGDPIGTGGVALTLNGIPADRAGVVYLVSPTVAPVPEPSTWAMAVAAFACGSVAIARRKQSRRT